MTELKPEVLPPSLPPSLPPPSPSNAPPSNPPLTQIASPNFSEYSAKLALNTTKQQKRRQARQAARTQVGGYSPSTFFKRGTREKHIQRLDVQASEMSKTVFTHPDTTVPKSPKVTADIQKHLRDSPNPHRFSDSDGSGSDYDLPPDITAKSAKLLGLKRLTTATKSMSVRLDKEVEKIGGVKTKVSVSLTKKLFKLSILLTLLAVLTILVLSTMQVYNNTAVDLSDPWTVASLVVEEIKALTYVRVVASSSRANGDAAVSYYEYAWSFVKEEEVVVEDAVEGIAAGVIDSVWSALGYKNVAGVGVGPEL